MSRDDVTVHVEDAREPVAKGTPPRRFVIVDAGMSELIRPALYGARHAVMVVRQRPRFAPGRRVDVVGPVCESADFLAEGQSLPRDVRPGDLLVVRSAGAYGASMSSTYNARPRAAEVMVESGTARVIRARERIEDLWRDESLG